MKSIIRTMAALFCLLVASATLLAQGHRHRGPAPLSQLIEQHATTLDLSEDQVARLTELDAATRAQLEALRADDSLTPEDRQAAARELRQTTKTELAAILTEAQLQQLRELRPERSERQRPDSAEREAHRTRKDALHAAVKAYRTENIEPVLRAQRQQLEAQISAADRATLDRLRTQLATAKAEAKAAKATFRSEHERGEQPRSGDREARRAAFAEFREQQRATHKAVKTELEPLLAKYDATITTLLAEIDNQQATWKADLKAIHEQHAPADKADRPRHRRPHPRHGDSADAAERPEHKGMSKAKFLLMEAAAAPATPAAPATLNRLSLYPNPSVGGETTATLRMQQAGPVRVELRTESGRVLKVLSDTDYPTGEHQLTIPTQGLRPGVYYISLSDTAGTRTERLVIN